VVPLRQYRRALLRVKTYHAEAGNLKVQLRRATAKAAKLKQAAAALRWASKPVHIQKVSNFLTAFQLHLNNILLSAVTHPVPAAPRFTRSVRSARSSRQRCSKWC
jgi:hypothetical protein